MTWNMRHLKRKGFKEKNVVKSIATTIRELVLHFSDFLFFHYRYHGDEYRHTQSRVVTKMSPVGEDILFIY